MSRKKKGVVSKELQRWILNHFIRVLMEDNFKEYSRPDKTILKIEQEDNNATNTD